MSYGIILFGRYSVVVEDVSCLLFYSQTLPVSYMVDQRNILFWKKALNCDNEVIRVLAMLNRGSIGMILSQYCIPTINMSVTDIKNCSLCGDTLWTSPARTLEYSSEFY